MPNTHVRTLAIDVGGTGLKATVLDAAGVPEHERVRVATTYPCPPTKLVADLVALVQPLPAADRVSVGFPGVVRGGVVRTAPHFVTVTGPGSSVDPDLERAWVGFDLAAALTARLHLPVRVANDAEVLGLGAIDGIGVELVVTLGTGFGSAVFRDGALALHLELAHHPLRGKLTYNEVLGDAARKKVGNKKWCRRVAATIPVLDALITPDSILIGGGNAARLDLTKLNLTKLGSADLAAKVRLIDNEAGLLGGIRLWADAAVSATSTPTVESPPGT